jgi:hypothetical protein
MILLKKKYVLISLNREQGYLYQKWKGFSLSPFFREAIDFSMNILEENSYYKIISNVTEQDLLPPRDQEYVKKRVIDFLKVHEAFRLAFITRENSIIDLCTKFYDRSLRREKVNGINRSFNDLKSAEEWLATQ